ncbi:MAG: Ig-like domain repeat protein [Thermoplasmatota archaeon]
MHTGKTKVQLLKLLSSAVLITLLGTSLIGVIGTSDGSELGPKESPKNLEDLYFSGLEALGYRPQLPYSGSPFIQTPEPMPEGAVYPPDPPTGSTASSAPTRATWDEYYLDGTLTVYVDVSSSGGGALSSNEQQLLDRYISDFVNYSYPRVKDWFDPLNRISEAVFYVHQIDGSSGVGGYYSPGTDEFHVDRADLSWAGVITAHEFQHYVHRQYDPYETLWIDEGCADYAAYLVYGISSATAGHVYAYLEYRPYYGLVVSDQTFYQDGTTAYYGVSFLYQIYMSHQYGGKNYTRALVRNTNRGTAGVSQALSTVGSPDDFMDSFQKWIVATRLNSKEVGDGEYVYPTQSYDYGTLRSSITKSHSGTPVGVPEKESRDINGYSVTTLRFSSPPSGVDTFRLKMTFSSGTPVVAFYPETSTNKDVTFLDFGGTRSISYDFQGWGQQYSSFQLILSSTGLSNVAYELDVLDLEAPTTTMLATPRSPDGVDDWYITLPKVTLTTESGSFIKYQIDSGAQTGYTESFLMPEGVHTLTYWSYDRHYNTEEKNIVEFKVDTQVPASSIDIQPSLPEDEWYTTPPLITLTTSHPESFIYYKWGNGDYQKNEGAFLALEGENVLYWKAVDQAGNPEIARSRSFRIDSVAPTFDHVIYPSEPNGENGWYTTNPLVTITSQDAELIYYAIGNGALETYLSPISVPDGENTLRITCYDKAGNSAEETRIRFMVDTVTPNITAWFDGFEYSDENSSQWLNIPPILNVEGSEVSMDINYTLNNGPAIDYKSPFEVPEGENEIRVRGKDRAGNLAEMLFFLVKVDKRVPFVEAGFTEETANGWFRGSKASVVLEPVGEDDRSSVIKIYYRWGTDTPSLYKDPVVMPEGINTFFYWAEDLAGNEMEPRSLQVKKDSTMPLIYLDIDGLKDGKIQIGKILKVDLTGSTDDGGIQAFSVDYYGSGDPDWTPNGVFEANYTDKGTYEVVAYVKDSAGNVVSQSFTVVVKDTQQSPVNASDGGPDTGLLLMVIAIGGSVIILLIVMGVVLVVVRRKQQEQTITPSPGPVHLRSGVGRQPHPGHRPAEPRKPPEPPQPPGQ